MTLTPSADYPDRLSRAALEARAAGLEGLLVGPGPDLSYLTGYVPISTERLTLLVVPVTGDPSLVVPILEHDSAAAAPGADNVTLVDWRDGADEYALTAGLLRGTGPYAVSDSTWAGHLLGLQRTAPGVTFTASSVALPMLRAVKTEAEIELLAAAGAAADAAFERILGVRFSGRREIEIAQELADLLVELGHNQVDFTIVASGPNGANPHHDSGERSITPGDLVVLDFGGLRHGYGSDTTRTVSVGGPTDEQQRVYDVVRNAQQAAFESVSVGVACEEVDRVARRVITQAGYGEHFIHRVGHGIGITTHEPPYLVEGETQSLQAGMCFSIEPGIYLPGRFGVRIEDIVVTTPNGARRLNNSSHELQVVG